MLIGKEQDWIEGEERAWQILSGLAYNDVCQRANVSFNESTNCYALYFFNSEIFISPDDKKILGYSGAVDFLLTELPQYSRLSILWYLIYAKDVPLSDRLINPREVNGGLIFAQGTHQFPLEEIAEKYGSDIKGFFQRGTLIGAEPMNYGDSSLRLFPFPRVPMVLILWKEDEEFPARADILFDATCSLQLPTDIIWSTAMMTVLAILR
jgi:hypothetical protein